MKRIVADRRWWITGGVFAALVAVIIAVSLSLSEISNGSATPVATPADAQVLEIGAVSGPNGDALLNVRSSSLTALNVEFLQFGDVDAITAALAAGTGDAVIVPESCPLQDGQEVIAKLYTVESGGTTGVQVLVAPKDSTLRADLQTLAKALQSLETIDYLNSVSGIKVSRIN